MSKDMTDRSIQDIEEMGEQNIPPKNAKIMKTA